jgi:hypothetical protein
MLQQHGWEFASALPFLKGVLECTLSNGVTIGIDVAEHRGVA